MSKFVESTSYGNINVDEFWRHAQVYSEKVKKFGENLLASASSQVESAREDIDEAKKTLNAIAQSSKKIEQLILTHARDRNADHLYSELSEALEPVQAELRRLFPSPDVAPNHEERKRAVHHTLLSVEDTLVKIGVKYNVPENQIRPLIDEFVPRLEMLVVLIGDLSEQHPVLRDALIVSVVAILAPEAATWILRPILRLFGFGPEGPVKGSFAAWVQRVFYGATVPKRSWFSLLQSMGMKLPQDFGKKIIGGIGAGVGVGLSIFSC
ncbi:hypothetical protein K474DRAFT_1609441 [Panus rudis PR-1116 ss-1]|nr:hypothetical protein K474DRAFT_1609441 [Panus rudis PR-1116 ss-1]